MIVGVPKETYPGESRVALVPGLVPELTKAGFQVIVQSEAGQSAGFSNADYTQKGAKIADTADQVLGADIVFWVRTLGANPKHYSASLAGVKAGQLWVGFCEPIWAPGPIQEFAPRGASLLSLELIPRITKAQSMDALSSMATIAGYKGVILAAEALPRIFPMLMTAAGTIKAAQVLVLGVGVAGLQAIASARRLGAVVTAYDVRKEVKEQVQSVGAKFLELPLDTRQAEGTGGYAAAQSEEQLQRQRQLMASAIAASDVVITTAAIPGKRSPQLVDEAMVQGMRPGSVIVDLSAERGGNCALTRLGERVTYRGVTILGPDNLPATVPFDSSQMYAKNLVTLLVHACKPDTGLKLDDEIVKGALVCHDGKIVHGQVQAALAQ